MAAKPKNPAKEHYQQLRVLSCQTLWEREVPAFNAASEAERMKNVAVVRAVGVVFSESGTEEQKHDAREWLRSLLQDPEEKIRRYAMTALPKLGADASEESALLDLLEKTDSDRERKALGQTLEKIGGSETLARAGQGQVGPLHRTLQKVRANIARAETPGTVRMDAHLGDLQKVRFHLRCREGLEKIVEMQLDAVNHTTKKFRHIRSEPGLVAMEPVGPCSLNDIYKIRGFTTAAMVLGTADKPADEVEALAAIIASPHTQRLFTAFTAGLLRYRLEFADRGHQRSLIRDITNRVFELCPELINDSRSAPWQIDIYQSGRRTWAELTARLRPDPRFAYRLADVPAASHPPLAACMAHLAGEMNNEIVWDPFCGSGLELIECALRGGVKKIIGTDRSGEAIEVARANVASALEAGVDADFGSCDFRDYSDVEALRPGGVTLMICNPPMGRRIPIANLRGLIADLFEIAAEALAPGGRLVFANPIPVSPQGNDLQLEFQQRVDLGGFYVQVEKYVRR